MYCTGWPQTYRTRNRRSGTDGDPAWLGEESAVLIEAERQEKPPPGKYTCGVLRCRGSEVKNTRGQRQWRDWDERIIDQEPFWSRMNWNSGEGKSANNEHRALRVAGNRFRRPSEQETP